MAFDPSCGRCHEQIVESHEAYPHAQQECIACHGGTSQAQRLSYRMTVMYRMRLPFTLFASDAAGLSDARCLTCHDRTTRTGIITSRGVRINHRASTEDMRCVVCHGNVGHELIESWPSKYSMNQCLRCHQSKSVYSEAGCEQCHDGKLNPLAKTSRSSFSLVHGPNWEQMHGLGDLKTCAACHESSMCGRCHGALVPHDSRTIIAQHRTAAIEANNKCATCHKDQSFCDGCHGIAMPHPRGFLSEHSAITHQVSRAVCDRCHVSEDCTACHRAHIHPGGATP